MTRSTYNDGGTYASTKAGTIMWTRLVATALLHTLLAGPGEARTDLTAASGELFAPWVALPVGSRPVAVAVGDVNGDGRQDAVVATDTAEQPEPDKDAGIHVFLQSGDGSLQWSATYLIGGQPSSVQVGDVNGDRRHDVVVGTRYDIGVFLQTETGTFDPVIRLPTFNSYKIALGDLDTDGRTDVVGIDFGSGAHDVEVFLQDETGALVSSAVYDMAHPRRGDLEVGDVNGDGLDDVAASGQFVPPHYGDFGVLLQTPEGGLSGPHYYDFIEALPLQGLAIGDVTGDGRNDVIVSVKATNSFLGVFAQTPEGTLGQPVTVETLPNPQPVEVVDVTGDGMRDVVVAHGGEQALGVYVQHRDGTLGREQLVPIPLALVYSSHGLAAGDLNSDGATDLAIADPEHGLVLLYGIPAARDPRPERDLDADRRSDVAVYHPSTGWWHVVPSSRGRLVSFPFGGTTYTPAVADYDGDGAVDVAVREAGGVWYVHSSMTGFLSRALLGSRDDQPVPADYDGDGLADAAVYSPDGSWLARSSRTDDRLFFELGGSTSRPGPADFDGDGRADPAVLEPDGWRIRESRLGVERQVALPSGDWHPVRGDFDGDGRSDPAGYDQATGRWAVELSTTGTLASFAWGGPGYVALGGGDYDGDGTTELVLYAEATGHWYIYFTASRQLVSGVFGGPGYQPVR